MKSSIRKIPNLKVLSVNTLEIVAAKGYTLYKQNRDTGKWQKEKAIYDGINSVFAYFPLLSRLTRAEISKYYILKSGTELCVARKGIFRRGHSDSSFLKTFHVKRGSRPMYICQDKDGSIYFGEYFQNMEKFPVFVYCSKDDGNTWNKVYTFPQGSINHVHGIYLDPYTQRLWFATGDRENECIIGYTEDGFKTVNEVFRGGQEYRTCVLFFYKDFIVFGTDSQYQKNVLKKFDRESLKITELQEVQGPVIRGAQFGEIAIISTDVEPSEVNKTKNAYVWMTRDGEHWEELCHAEKDFLPSMLFQFGVFDLPQYSSDYNGNKIYVTGKAVKGCGGDTLVYDLNEK